MKKEIFNFGIIACAAIIFFGCTGKDKSIPKMDSSIQVTSTLLANSGYQVYIHTGHGPDTANKLWDSSTFSLVNSKVSGIWVFEPTFTLTSSHQTSLVANVDGTNRPGVIECAPYLNTKNTIPTWFQNNTYPPQLMRMYNKGFLNTSLIMLYREFNGTWIRPSDVDSLKAGIARSPIPAGAPTNYWTSKPWLTLMRYWGTEQAASIALNEVGGVVFEIAPCVGYNSKFSTDVPTAIKYALDRNKWAFVLLPPQNKAISGIDPNINGNYLKGVQDAHAKLKAALGSYISNSKLVFVPANYDYNLKGVDVTPESYVLNGGTYNSNTQTGAARWLSLVK